MKIQRIHHYSMKCASPEDALRVKAFYCDLLGMTIVTEWDGGFMLDCGGGMVEVFTGGEGSRETGALRHLAFEVDDVDAFAGAAKEAGCEVFLGPKDIVVPVPARIAFCFGPLGEQVEFFCPRT